MNQLNHEQLLNAQLVMGDDGKVGAYDRRTDNPGYASCVWTDQSFDQRWFTAVCAMPTLYQQLYQQWVALDACIEINEKHKKSNPLLYVKMNRLYIRMQNAIMKSLRVATEGTMVVRREEEAETTMRGLTK